MGVMKREKIETEIGVDEVEEGLRWLSMWGKNPLKTILVNGLRFVVLDR